MGFIKNELWQRYRYLGDRCTMLQCMYRDTSIGQGYILYSVQQRYRLEQIYRHRIAVYSAARHRHKHRTGIGQGYTVH